MAIEPSSLDLQPSGLPFVRLRNLPEQVADGIVEGVAAGILKPGQRLREADLSARMSVSRVPVREALKILDTQGVVQCVPHRGVRVVEIDDRKITQVRDARVALEKIAVRQAAATYAREPARLQRLDVIIDRMAEISQAEDWSALNQADIAFHREVLNASNNEIVLNLWEGLARHIRIIFAVESYGNVFAKTVVREHRVLREALARGDGRSLGRVIDDHINAAAGRQARGDHQ